jgi:spore maturation protein CgeB
VCSSDLFVNLVTQNHEHTITKRTFEILGSGGFALSSDNTAIRELFVPGRDLAVSSSPEQTLELVRYYKEHPDEWRKVRDSAVLSVQNHTYKQRAEFIVQKYQEYWP